MFSHTDNAQLAPSLIAHPDHFAHDLLASLGFPTTPLETANGWSNGVYTAPRHVVRISSGRFHNAYAHECTILSKLPAAVPHAQLVASGCVEQREWMLLQRVPGAPLQDVWCDLTLKQRKATITQLGQILRALHTLPVDDSYTNPWLAEALDTDGARENAYHAPPHSYDCLLEAAYKVPAVDPSLLAEVEMFIQERLPAFAGDHLVLVHADLHFANIMWHDGQIMALLDFEGARLAPADLELDTLLRFAREPELYQRHNMPSPVTARDLERLPDWLHSAYPGIMAHPRLGERLEVYEALWQLVQLLHFPPNSGPPDPWGHLSTLLNSSNSWAYRL